MTITGEIIIVQNPIFGFFVKLRNMQVDSPNSNRVVFAHGVRDGESSTEEFPPNMATSVSAGAMENAAALCPLLAWNPGTLTCKHSTLIFHPIPPDTHHIIIPLSSSLIPTSVAEKDAITVSRVLILGREGMNILPHKIISTWCAIIRMYYDPPPVPCIKHLETHFT